MISYFWQILTDTTDSKSISTSCGINSTLTGTFHRGVANPLCTWCCITRTIWKFDDLKQIQNCNVESVLLVYAWHFCFISLVVSCSPHVFTRKRNLNFHDFFKVGCKKETNRTCSYWLRNSRFIFLKKMLWTR